MPVLGGGTACALTHNALRTARWTEGDQAPSHPPPWAERYWLWHSACAHRPVGPVPRVLEATFLNSDTLDSRAVNAILHAQMVVVSGGNELSGSDVSFR